MNFARILISSAWTGESGGSVSTDERSFGANFEKGAAFCLQNLFGCFDLFAAKLLPAARDDLHLMKANEPLFEP